MGTMGKAGDRSFRPGVAHGGLRPWLAPGANAEMNGRYPVHEGEGVCLGGEDPRCLFAAVPRGGEIKVHQGW